MQFPSDELPVSLLRTEEKTARERSSLFGVNGATVNVSGGKLFREAVFLQPMKVLSLIPPFDTVMLFSK